MPSPVGGLNLSDPIDQMDPSYALALENVVPNGLSCSVRKGHSFLAGLGSASALIQTLEGMANSDGTYQVLAAASSTLLLYRVTSGSMSSIGGPYASAVFNSDTFGYRTFLCNGIDDVQVVATGSAAASTFSGVTLGNLINVSSFKERVYFVEKNTLKTWYGNSQAIGGSALSSYDFQFAMKCGGYLVSCGSFSNNYADSTQDLFYALSSEGEILFYTGSSPADVTTPWGLVKRAKIGRPLGYRAFVSVENDIWLLTDQGIVPITAIFAATPSVALDTVGAKINPLIATYAANVPFSHLWRGEYCSKERKVYITVPISEASTFLLVYNLVGKAWTTYKLYEDKLALKVMSIAGSVFYGGYSGNVYTGETGNTDYLTASTTNATQFFGRGAFSFYGNRGLWKAYRDCRPLIKTTRGVNLSLGLDTDFKQTPDTSTIAAGQGIFTPWGSPWGSPWSSGVDYIYDRHAAKGQGYSASIKFRGAINGSPLELNGFDMRYTQGTW
jgi:hypothetical protein